MSSSKRTILLTGGSSGIGLFAAKNFLKSDPNVTLIIGSRTAPTEDLGPRAIYKPLDLASTASVRKFVDGWDQGSIWGLLLNAGGRPSSLTYNDEGVEMTIAINHLGHALLFFLLNEKGAISPTCRIIFTSSAMHDPKAPMAPAGPHYVTAAEVAKATDPKLQNSLVRYATSKLEVMFFIYALVRRMPAANKNWSVIAFEPGFSPGRGSKLGVEGSAVAGFVSDWIIPSMLWIFKLGGTAVSSAPKSGKLLADLALDDKTPSLHGKYIILTKERPASDEAHDQAKQDDLWDWTIKTVAKNSEEAARFNAL